jgi:hypothetical protein
LKLSKLLGSLGLKEVLSAPLKALGESEESYSEHLSKTLDRSGVEIIEVPAIPHMEIVRRSVARKRPCDDKGDGYRDTLNWLTFLAVANDNPDDRLILVTNDSDFASQDSSGLHPDLMEDLGAIGASARVSLVRGLKELVLTVAAERSVEVGDDLRVFADQLRDSTILEYLSSSTLPSAFGSSLDAYACGLPFETVSARLLEAGNPRDLRLEITGSISDDLVVGQFEVKADAAIEVDTVIPAKDSETSSGSLDTQEEPSQLSKTLSFHGIITLDVHGKPQTAELSTIEALPEDPGRAEWEEARKAIQVTDWAKTVTGLPTFQGLILPPGYFSKFVLPADYLKAVSGISKMMPPADYLKAVSGISKMMPPLSYLNNVAKAFPPDYFKDSASTTANSDAEPDDQGEGPDTPEPGEAASPDED